MSENNRPPAGIMPEFVWKSKRLMELHDTIVRHLNAGLQIDNNWIVERNTLLSQGIYPIDMQEIKQNEPQKNETKVVVMTPTSHSVYRRGDGTIYLTYREKEPEPDSKLIAVAETRMTQKKISIVNENQLSKGNVVSNIFGEIVEIIHIEYVN